MSDADDAQDWGETAAQDAGPDEFGPALRAAREKAGLSVDDVATALKVTDHTIDALEAERLEELPPLPYIRGYVKRYARLVGLDADALTVGSDFPAEAETVVPAIVPRSRWALFTDFARRSWGLVYGSIVLVFVMLIGGALWWAWPGGNAELAFEATSGIAGPDPVPPFADAPPPPIAAPAEGLPSHTNPDPVPGLPTVSGQPAAPVADDPTPSPASPPEAGVVVGDVDESATDDREGPLPDLISFTFHGECWVEVHDRDGDLIHGDLGRDGDTVTLGGRAPFSVLVGNVTGVEVTFNGERVALDQSAPGAVARLVVGD